jgi:imidazole glycerol-phosphate synthase subunit HisF
MSLQKRIIPCLLLRNGSLVKTVKFNKFGYVGDPVNTIRIFNELEVDELILVDILASKKGQKPDFKLIKEVASECFMPLTYGGGIDSVEDIKKILYIGVEKVSINTFAVQNPQFITEAAEIFGNQCIIGAIDVKKDFFGKYFVVINDGREKTNLDPIEWAIEMEKIGAGELLITSIDCDGTWEGYDTDLIKSITDKVSIPVIANGGAGNLSHIRSVLTDGDCSAAAVGSFVVYQKKGMGILINSPFQKDLKGVYNE